jgi:copper chaperone CopZ
LNSLKNCPASLRLCDKIGVDAMHGLQRTLSLAIPVNAAGPDPDRVIEYALARGNLVESITACISHREPVGNLMQYIIDAENIKCGGCVSTIKDALGRISGVHEVEADITTGRVTVTADEGIRDKLTAALRESGYPERKPP